MRTLQFLTGTLPQGKASVTYVPTLCLAAETQKTRPSSATSPDSPDGGWSVTGETLNNFWLEETLWCKWVCALTDRKFVNWIFKFLYPPVWMTIIAWLLFVMAPMRASFREGSCREGTCLCPPWMTSAAALESETLTALHTSPTPPLVSGTTVLYSNYTLIPVMSLWQLHVSFTLDLWGFAKLLLNRLCSFLNNRNALEGYDKPDGELDESVSNLHNLVHSLLNGTSALSHSAANDPIFVVRIWFNTLLWALTAAVVI